MSLKFLNLEVKIGLFHQFVSLDQYFCASSGSNLILFENVGLKTQFPIPFYSLV